MSVNDFLESWQHQKDILRSDGLSETQIKNYYNSFKVNQFESPQSLASNYVRDGVINHPIYVKNFYLVTGNTYAWEITNLSATNGSYPDTVMRLMKPVASPNKLYDDYNEIEVNDDGGVGLASKISNFTPSQTGWYTIIVHGYGPSSYGTFDLKFNGQIAYENKPFGGIRFTYSSVEPGDHLQSLFKAGGVYGHQMLVLDSLSPVGCGSRIYQRLSA